MKKVILAMRDKFEFVYEELNIQSDAQLFEKYKEKIPVLLINGKLFAKYSVNAEKLRTKLLKLTYN